MNRFLVRSIALVLSFSFAALLSLRAEPILPPGFALEVVAGPDVVSEPMDMAFAPDGAVWVTGRNGEVWRIDGTSHGSHLVGKVDTDVSGDRGLHGVAFHPDFPKTPHLFLSYHDTHHETSHYRARIVRWTVAGKGDKASLEPGSERVILEWEGDAAGQHVGGGLLAHPKEHVLYVTTGENNQNAKLREYCDDPENRAQSLRDLRGKVLRVGFDGSVPKDNPFVKTPGAQGLIFTRGHRQPWALTLDAPTGLILVAENGGDLADDYDEVNRVVAGANYGWPKAFGEGWSTLTRTNHVEGFTPAWFAYKRNNGASCVGAVIYRGSKKGIRFPAKYEGNLFYADFARRSIRTAPVDPKSYKAGESEPFLQNLAAGPLALRLGPDGALYYITHGGAPKPSPQDALVRIVTKP